MVVSVLIAIGFAYGVIRISTDYDGSLLEKAVVYAICIGIAVAANLA